MEVEIRHHGRVIRGDLLYPKQRRKLMPAVLLVHGKAADRKYQWFPILHRLLRQRGYVALSIDLSGHGRSDGRFEDLTYTRAAQDVAVAAGYLGRQPGVNPHSVGAVGHSLGGAAVIIAQSLTRAFKTLVLVASVGDLMRRELQKYSPNVRAAWRRTDNYSWFDRRLQRTLSLKFNYWRDARRYDTLALAAMIHQPVLVVAAGRDKSISRAETERLYRAFNQPKRLVVVHGARHSFRPPAQRRKLLDAILPWLKEYLAQRTSRVVNVYIRNQGEYLVVKRSNQVGYYRGRWAIVSGHLVRGVSVLAQAYHEAREEAGMRRRDLQLIRVGKIVRRIDREVGKTWLITPVLMESKTRRVKLDWEHTAYRWIRLKDFPVQKSYPGIEKQFSVLKLT